MANQGRRRLAISKDGIVHGQPNQARAGESSSPNTFTYKPLDASVDGIRLLILDPGVAKHVPVSCQLVHMTFGQMPKYEALSYTWGSDKPRDSIFIDGRKFRVRYNLWRALIHLRMPYAKRALWIDAICINQNDIPERNQQLRIMPHIYSRAQVVLVWLGTGVTPFRGKYSWIREGETKIRDSGPDNDSFARRLLHMSQVDYWHRVWIIQEIGKARRILVHYGETKVDWEIFIRTMRLYQKDAALQGSLPIRLADQMLNKYGDAYKLESLIITHQEARCQDVRDKIYGFTGLANDTYGRLPMDFAKTPFEVWGDVVRFRNGDTTIRQYDILQFAEFTRKLLGGHLKMNTKTTAIGENGANDLGLDMGVDVDGLGITNLQSELVLCPARLWGRIAWVGPSYNEIRANLRKVDEWIASIREHVPEKHIRTVYEENDMLLQLLEDLDYSDLAMASIVVPKTRYRLEPSEQGEAVNIMSNTQAKSSSLRADQWYSSSTATLDEKHLILLDLYPRVDESDPAAQKSFTRIGFAPYAATIGDFICCFYQKQRAVVVRKSKNKKKKDQFSIVASAVFPDFRSMAAEKKESDKKVEAKFSILNDTPLKRAETINLYMDIRMVYEWSF
jgi:hypothetical protein